MKNSIIIFLFCLMTINLIRSQDIINVSNTVSKEVDGEWILYSKYGEKITGIVLTNYSNNKLASSKTYIDGKLNGLYKAYYTDGNLKFNGNFKDDKKQGLCKWYYENGNLEEKGNFHDGNPTGLYQWYFENGKIKQRSTIKNGEYLSTQKFPKNEEVVIRDSLIDSLSIALNDYLGLTDFFGVLIEVPISETEVKKIDGQDIRYLNGEKFTGTALEYFPNGSRKYTGSFKNGKKEGLEKIYYLSGYLKQKGNFEKGLRNELYEWFYENGNIWYHVNYIKGERNGDYKEYHLNGHLKWKGIFRNDNYDGDWTEYDLNGKFIQKLKYNNGEIINQ